MMSEKLYDTHERNIQLHCAYKGSHHRRSDLHCLKLCSVWRSDQRLSQSLCKHSSHRQQQHADQRSTFIVLVQTGWYRAWKLIRPIWTSSTWAFCRWVMLRSLTSRQCIQCSQIGFAPAEPVEWSEEKRWVRRRKMSTSTMLSAECASNTSACMNQVQSQESSTGCHSECDILCKRKRRRRRTDCRVRGRGTGCRVRGRVRDCHHLCLHHHCH